MEENEAQPEDKSTWRPSGMVLLTLSKKRLQTVRTQNRLREEKISGVSHYITINVKQAKFIKGMVLDLYIVFSFIWLLV